VLLALDGVASEIGELDREATQIFVPNAYVAEIAKRHEEFLFGASINPHRTGWYERLAQAKRDGAVLNKWLPAIMQIDPGDHALEAFYSALVTFDMPLLVHVGDENAFPSADNNLGDPMRLLVPLEAGVTVIAAHVATTGKSDGEDNFHRLIKLIDQYPNLYVDISSLTQVNKRGYLSRALATEGVEARMLYGSDWPLQSFPLVSPWWHIGYAPLAELRYAAQLQNPFDRDIAIKVALGTPKAVFARVSDLIPGQLHENFVEEIQ
jgi:predicted TIM-barrel fold metal-dependent hydrolase